MWLQLTPTTLRAPVRGPNAPQHTHNLPWHSSLPKCRTVSRHTAFSGLYWRNPALWAGRLYRISPKSAMKDGDCGCKFPHALKYHCHSADCHAPQPFVQNSYTRLHETYTKDSVAENTSQMDWRRLPTSSSSLLQTEQPTLYNYRQTQSAPITGQTNKDSAASIGPYQTAALGTSRQDTRSIQNEPFSSQQHHDHCWFLFRL